MKNPFPRGSTEPTTSPAAESAKSASGWRIGANNLQTAGEATNNKPTLRGMEANTGDGRASRTATFSPESTRGDLKGAEPEVMAPVPTDIAGYGTQDPGCAHTQGGMGGVRDGGMAGPAAENFDS